MAEGVAGAKRRRVLDRLVEVTVDLGDEGAAEALAWSLAERDVDRQRDTLERALDEVRPGLPGKALPNQTMQHVPGDIAQGERPIFHAAIIG
jgi:hypothetical protein